MGNSSPCSALPIELGCRRFKGDICSRTLGCSDMEVLVLKRDFRELKEEFSVDMWSGFLHALFWVSIV